MNISYYETKEELTITVFTKNPSELKVSLLNETTLLINKKEIKLFKGIKEIIKIKDEQIKLEIKLRKKMAGYWRCITEPDRYRVKRYCFDDKEEVKIDNLERFMYHLYENGSKELKRSMNQSFFESEGRELSTNLNKNK